MMMHDYTVVNAIMVQLAGEIRAHGTNASVCVPPWHYSGQTGAQWCALPDPAACLCLSLMPSDLYIAPCTLSSCPQNFDLSL